jgi:hypothetical protein
MSLSNLSKNLITNPRIVDFDIQGIVGIRLINPTISDSAAVAKQLDQKKTHLERDPDIIISFKDNFNNTSLKYIGLDYAGFNDEGFYVLGGGKEKLKMRVPFEKIGQNLELECESGVDPIPLLDSIINLTFLAKNHIPLHASAFVYNGIGNLVTGWTKGGKTEALLSFANHSAQYVGDEWVIISPAGESMFGLPVKLCIWDWQFKYIPNLLPKITIDRKILFRLIYFLDTFYKIFSHGKLKESFLLEWINKALPSFKRQLNIRVRPEIIFKNGICKKSSFDKLFLMMARSEPKITIEPWDPSDIASRMVSSNDWEQKTFWEYYEAFKFAFPYLQNEFLEGADKFQKSQLECAFKNKEAYKVSHPYPVDFEDLFAEMKKVFTKKSF